MTGDEGAPCGNRPLKHAIWAIVVAASSGRLYGAFINSPRTRPKWICEKKSFKSILKTRRFLVCCSAFPTLFFSSINPYAQTLGSYTADKTLANLRCISFSALSGAEISRVVPSFLGILKVWYIFSGRFL